MTKATDSVFPMLNESAGLTIREYFAAKALQGYCAAGSSGMPRKEQIAALAVALADTLIEELNKDKE